jgi:hypothetical protein
MARYSQAQQAENAAVKASGLPGPWGPHPLGQLFRRGIQRCLQGDGPEARRDMRALLPTGGSQGNAGVVRGAPRTGRIGRGGLASGVQQVAAAPYQEAYADPRHGGNVSRLGGYVGLTNGSTIRYDRHIMAKTGTERQQAHPDSTRGDGYSPLADGPARPSFMMVHRVYNPTYGNTGTRFLDNSGPFALTKDNRGEPRFLGTQDGSPYTTKWGGAPGLTHVYGVRGSSGAVGPAMGSPQDAPQKIRGGVPHGLHSRPQSNRAITQARFKATPQQARRRPQLLANSQQAGQSYSQTVQHLGQPPRPVPRIAGRALPGMTGKVMRRG